MDNSAPRLSSNRPFSRLLITMTAAVGLVAAAVGLSGSLSGNSAAAQPGTGTARYFLHIDGIQGESADAAHKNQIELLSYEWSSDGEPGLEQPSTNGGGTGGGLTGGRVQANAIHFTQNVSRASPLLMVSVASAKQFREATLSVVRSGEPSLQQVKVRLTDVTVTSYRTTSRTPGAPTDEFTLSFGKVDYSYTPQDTEGRPASSVVASWDFETNSGG